MQTTDADNIEIEHNIWAILPVKAFDKSKQRLSQVLTEQQRQSLAEAMLKDVLAALTSTHSIQHVVVVTSNKDIASLAIQYQAQVVMESDHCKGLNQAVLLGVHHAEFHGGKKALVLHGDIPLVTTHDLDFIVKEHLQGSVTLVPDSNNDGTNALFLELPVDVEFQYGAGSFSKHLELFRSKGLLCDIAELHDLMLDIDSPEDLLDLANRLLDQDASSTSRCLQRPDMQEAIIAISRAQAV